MKSWSEKFWEARPLRGNGFLLSRQAFHARRLHLLHGGAGHRAAAVRERGETLTITKIYR